MSIAFRSDMLTHTPELRPLAWNLAVRLLLAPLWLGVAHGQPLGIVADDGNDAAVVFDTDALTPVTVLPIGDGSGVVGDCSITNDGSTAFVSDFDSYVWPVDLTASPPALDVSGPVAVSTLSEDTALSPDGRFLVVCDGFGSAPVSVVDVESRAEVSTFSLGSNCSAVDVCEDGTVLAVSSGTGKVHRLFLDDAGALSHSGEALTTGWLSTRGPNDAVCAPGSAAGVVVRRIPATLLSFRIDGMTAVDERPLAGPRFGISLAAGDGVAWARSDGNVEAFDFDTATGALGASARLSFPTATALPFLGIDQLALAPAGDRVFVPVPGGLGVYDATDGSSIGSLVHPALGAPTGVCLAAGEPEPANEPPDCSGGAADVDVLFPPRGDRVPVGVLGVIDPEGDPISITVTGVSQDEPTLGRGRPVCPDGEASGASALVRAERDGWGDGRVYDVAFSAVDGNGGECTGVVTVCVPLRSGGGCVDSGVRFDSATCE